MATDLILIIEDDPFTLSMLSGVVASAGFTVHGENTAAKAIQFAKEYPPAAVLVDLDLGEGPTGIDVAHGLRRLIPTLGIVLLTSYEDPRLHRPNLPQLPIGAKYLVKQEVTSQNLLVDAITQSIQIPVGKSSNGQVQDSDLSDIQIETLRLIAKGLSNGEIARIRYVTEKTVEQTITKLAKQFNIPQAPHVNSRVQLARLYFKRAGQAIEIE